MTAQTMQSYHLLFIQTPNILHFKIYYIFSILLQHKMQTIPHMHPELLRPMGK